jgi:MFS family permease
VSPLHRNLPTLQVLALLFMFDVTVSVRQLIYSEGGLNQSAIGVILTVPWAVILLTDLPTGRLADEFSYKHMLVTGCALLTGSYVLLAVAGGFWSYLASAALLGLGISCYRGVPYALSSVTLGALHDPEIEQHYKRFVKWSLAFAALGEALASLATFSIIDIAGEKSGPQLSAWLQVVVYGTMTIVAWISLTDVRPQGIEHRGLLCTLKSGWKETFGQVQRVFHEAPLVRAVVLYGAVIGCTTQTMVWLTQVYLQRTGVDTAHVPLLWFGYHVALLAFTMVIALYEKMMGGRWAALASLPVIAMTAYLALIWVSPGVGRVVLLAFYFVRAVQMLLVTVYLMKLVAERLRATIMAVMSTIQFALFSVMNPVLNASVDAFPRFSHGTGAAFALSAAVYGAGGIGLVLYMRKHRAEAQS